MDKAITDLHAAVVSVCPIDGISIGKFSDRSTWSIGFSKDATIQQKAAAQAVLDGWSFDHTLDEAKFYYASLCDEAVRSFVLSKYPQHRQLTLTNLKIGASPRRLAYLDTLWSWIGQCIGYYYALEDAIVAARSKEEVRAVYDNWSESEAWQAIRAADPEVTIRQTLSLLD